MNEQTHSLTGLEQAHQLLRTGAGGPMMQLLNLLVEEIAVGRCVIGAVPEARFENSMGRMHGGFAATLIDTAMGWAVLSKLPARVGFGTIDLGIKYVRKLECNTGKIFTTATVLHAGRTMLTAEAKVADASGVLYAHGTGTFLVYPT